LKNTGEAMAVKTSTSDALFAKARMLMPGGVNSPVRAFRAVGRAPLFIARAQGSSLWDVDGNVFIDYVGSWGPMIVGHAHPRVLEALVRAAGAGTSFGAPTGLEVRMAEMICRLVPSIAMVRMVNSGTEATMSAVRLARAYTGRSAIIKFEGCYHGHGDSFLIRAGSGAMTFGVPDSPGVPPALAAETLIARFNDISSVQEIVAKKGNTIAAVIVEPVAGNMGCVPPERGFLEDLRRLCTQEKILLIFDEVMTGFRLAPGGAQELYGVTPDLTTLGKIIGGGLPVGAYGGRKEIMEMVAPSGPVYQAGTLSGNPLAMTAGLETLAAGIQEVVHSLGLPLSYNRVGSMATLFFTPTRVIDYTTALTADARRFAVYFREMLDRGIYLAPSQFEATFMSDAHSDEDIDRTVGASREALRKAFS
jgi:glutamate-1-semialdehyde 2,1-aminomutase